MTTAGGATPPQGGPAISISGDSLARLLRAGVLDPPPHPGPMAALDGYSPVAQLGDGGMGIVFLARAPDGGHCAIKVMRPELAADEKSVQLFQRNARFMMELRHPGILPVTRVSDRPEGPYFVMPYVEKGSLARLIAGKPLPREKALAIALQVAAALDFAHAKGISHRDLKPANVMIGDDDKASLIDFGLARTVFNDSFIDVHNQPCEGTAAYMSPELAAGRAGDTRCDIYSFGALLYEMLTGRPPYDGSSVSQVTGKVLHGPPAPIRQINPQADEGLGRVAEWAMARELRDRYASMTDVLADRGQHAEEGPQEPPAYSPAPSGAKPLPSRAGGVIIKSNMKLKHFPAFGGMAALLAILLGSSSQLAAQVQDPAVEAKRFIADYEMTVCPLQIAAWKTAWTADITGKDEDFKAREAAENRLNAVLADKQQFARLERARQALHVSSARIDAQIARQIELLHLQYLEKQLDPALLQAMTMKASAATRAFNTYRAKVDGKELTASQVLKVLKESKDSAERKRVWEASKAVGTVVENDLKELVKLRNQAARKLGFADYYAMQLELNELSKAQVLKIFDELYELTRQPFKAAKDNIDARLAAEYGITPAELRPWHCQDLFFQEAPAVYAVKLDSLYAKADILKLSRDFYAGIGLPVDKVLESSDLFEKPGKYPHAQCSDLDLEGDVRVMANVVSDEYWMGTMLHELGHAVYSTPNIPLTVPWVLRQPAHIFTTEGIAMMMEQFSKSGDWIAAMGLDVPDAKAVAEAGAKMQRDQLLIFAAWSQVMVRFEMAMYANPDQDLNTLWWDLVEKYQLVHRPEGRNAPDYASKIHIVSAPAYYHNYMMGRLFASQLRRTIAKEVLKADPDKAVYNGNKEVGAFLKRMVFAPGRTRHWSAMVIFATGEELSAKAFAADISAR